MPDLRTGSGRSRRFWWRQLWRLDHWPTGAGGSVRTIGWIVIFRRHNRLDGLHIGPYEWTRGQGWSRWTKW